MSKTVLTIGDYRDTQPSFGVHLTNQNLSDKIDFNTVSKVEILFPDGTKQEVARDDQNTTADDWYGSWQYDGSFLSSIKTSLSVVASFTDNTVMTIDSNYVLEVGKAF